VTRWLQFQRWAISVKRQASRPEQWIQASSPCPRWTGISAREHERRLNHPDGMTRGAPTAAIVGGSVPRVAKRVHCEDGRDTRYRTGRRLSRVGERCISGAGGISTRAHRESLDF
jgi:hypothetical protein